MQEEGQDEGYGFGLTDCLTAKGLQLAALALTDAVCNGPSGGLGVGGARNLRRPSGMGGAADLRDAGKPFQGCRTREVVCWVGPRGGTLRGCLASAERLGNGCVTLGAAHLPYGRCALSLSCTAGWTWYSVPQ